jgi:aspartyl aminopeptidase
MQISCSEYHRLTHHLDVVVGSECFLNANFTTFPLTCVVSADMADAMHPSQVCPAGQEETFYHPKLRDGLVLRESAGNSNDIVTALLFKEVAKRNNIPIQVRLESI